MINFGINPKKLQMHKASLFDEWANKYEQTIENCKNQYPFAGYSKIISTIQAKINKGDRLLDLGTGTAYMLYKLLEVKDFQYFGIDFSEKMLEIAKSKLETSVFFQWDLAQNSIPNILQGKRFEVILSAFTFHHFDLEKKLAILQLYKTLLTEKGQFIIADISFDNLEDLKKVKKGGS